MRHPGNFMLTCQRVFLMWSTSRSNSRTQCSLLLDWVSTNIDHEVLRPALCMTLDSLPVTVGLGLFVFLSYCLLDALLIRLFFQEEKRSHEQYDNFKTNESTRHAKKKHIFRLLQKDFRKNELYRNPQLRHRMDRRGLTLFGFAHGNWFLRYGYAERAYAIWE